MLTQNLPTTAADYARAQRLEQQAAIASVLRQWRRMGNEFDPSWAQISPGIVATVQVAQGRIAAQSAAYIPAVLEETGQTAAIAAAAQINTEAIVGVTGTGARVADVLALAPIRAKQAMQSTFIQAYVDPLTGEFFPAEVSPGQSAPEALKTAGKWLSGTVGTIFSDTGRTIESLGINTRPIGGYVRMLTPPSCARCVVLAGKWFRKNEGFKRHPECDCRHIPASEAVGGDMLVSPADYFDSLDDSGKLKLAGSQANLKAIEDGADLIQIVNAYRRTNGMQVAGVSPIKTDRFGNRFTTEGTTRRGLAGAQQIGLRSNGRSQARLMPATIYKIAKDDADKMRLLKLYGWVRDDEGLTRGRDILADQRRERRNARARSRRAERH